MSSRSLNKVMLIGNLTRDAVVKFTSSGTAVATFAIATNRSWTTAEGQIKEDVQYHNIVAWAKLAELVGKLLHKGKKVYVEGRLTSRKYTDKTGVERYITEIVMDDFILMSMNEGKKPDQANESTPAAVEEFTQEVEQPKEPSSQSINPDDIPF
ncbi:MAG: single-stranded DNA-binding protein [bacterium]